VFVAGPWLAPIGTCLSRKGFTAWSAKVSTGLRESLQQQTATARPSAVPRFGRMLDLSKIEAGRLDLNPQTVQLAPLINDVISTAGQLAEQNKNRLVVDAQENLGALTVDPMRLRQILLNLLSNACKFTKEGEVKLAARKVSTAAASSSSPSPTPASA
jgi:signal transduction histidine kinase